MAIVLLVYTIIKEDSSFVSVLVYSKKDHKHCMIALWSSEAFVLNSDDLKRRYCLKEGPSFHSVRVSFTNIASEDRVPETCF
jgi:hypothetical protein